MLKKIITSLIAGALLFTVIFLVSRFTIIFNGIETAYSNFLFFIREPAVESMVEAYMPAPDEDLYATNEYVSARAKLLGFDEEALGILGKWPWYRDVHAEFLTILQQFSPETLHFDISFIVPEQMPRSLNAQLAPQPKIHSFVRNAFSSMDNALGHELSKHDNVFIDLFLFSDERSDMDPSILQRISQTEQLLDEYSQPMDSVTKEKFEGFIMKSMEPVIHNIAKNAHPLSVTIYPDEDNKVRSFPLVSLYRTSDGRELSSFTILLALLMEYYHVDKDFVTLTMDNVTLNNAIVPYLDNVTKQPITKTVDFTKIKGKIKRSAKLDPYNRNLYNFLVNEQRLWMDPDDTEFEPMPPSLPVHIHTKNDGSMEIIDGAEVYDAAVLLGCKEVKAVFYRTKNIVINTPYKQNEKPHAFYINYAGKERSKYYDPEYEEAEEYTPVDTDSYLDVMKIGKLPDIPLIDKKGKYSISRNFAEYRKWFKGYCDDAALKITSSVPSEERLMSYIFEENQDKGKLLLYSYFLNEVDAGGIQVRANDFDDYQAAYQGWLEAAGFPVDEFLLLNNTQFMDTLWNAWYNGFKEYHNRFCFAGAYATGLGGVGDVKETPYGAMFGIDVIINAFSTIVTDNQIARSSATVNFILLLIFAVIFSIAYGLLDIRINSYIFIVTLIGTFVVKHILFDTNNYILEIFPLATLNVTIFGSLIIYKLMTEEKDKKFIKATFANYLSQELIDDMIDNKQMPQLGGESRRLSAYFTDIQGFSTFSEKLTASQLVELLNEYLSDMTDILMAQKGTLDKYEGDAIIAFVGAPVELPDHGLRACQAAVNMQARLLELREKWKNEKAAPDEPNRNTKNLPEEEWAKGSKWPTIVHEMMMRIGINSGEIVVGNMGSTLRKNYTMMGDSVNLAARLEAGAKQYGVYSMVSEYLLNESWTDENGKKMTVRDGVEVRLLDNITVVGKSEPVKVYELCAMKGGLSAQEKELFKIFDEGMALYLDQKWDDAIAKFKESLKIERVPEGKTTPSQVMIERCETFKENPPEGATPGSPWDGVYRLTSK